MCQVGRSWIFSGKTFISLVAFLFRDTRVRGIAVPFHRHFFEVNLRFYVQAQQDGELRRGVCFIREVVPKRAIAWVARELYGEPYIRCPMRGVKQAISSEEIALSYKWKYRGCWNQITVEVSGEPQLPVAGSEAEFIAEHYWGYTAQSDGSTREYRVEHPTWRIWEELQRSELHLLSQGLYSKAFTEVLQAPPSSVFVAEGSEITVSFSKRLPGK